jgi:hypothetical protein
MTYKEAAAFVMPFGKNKGRTLDAIATEDAGLTYLDWLRGERAAEDKNYDIDKALQAYLNDPSIKKELAALL